MWRCCAQKHPASKPVSLAGSTQNSHGLRPARHARCARKQHARSSVSASSYRPEEGRGTPRHDDFQGCLDASLRFNPAEDVFAERIRGQNGATSSSVPWEQQGTWRHHHQQQQQQQQEQQQQHGRLAYAFGTGLLGRGISASHSPRPGFVHQDFHEGDLSRLQSEFWRQKHELQLHRREQQEQGDGLEYGEASQQQQASSRQELGEAGEGVRQRWFQEVDLRCEQEGGSRQGQGPQSGQHSQGLTTDSEGHRDNIITPVAFYEAGASWSCFEADKPEAVSLLTPGRLQATSLSSEHGSNAGRDAAEQVNGAHVQQSSPGSVSVNGFGTYAPFLGSDAAVEAAKAAEAAGEGQACETEDQACELEYRLRAVLEPAEAGAPALPANGSVVTQTSEEQQPGEASSQPSVELGPVHAGEEQRVQQLEESREERVEQPAGSATVAGVGIHDASRQEVAPAKDYSGLSLASTEAEIGSPAVLAGGEQELVLKTGLAEEQAAQVEQETQLMAKQLAFAQKLMYPDEPEAVEPERAEGDSAAAAMGMAEDTRDEGQGGHQEAAGALDGAWEQEEGQGQEQEGHLVGRQEALSAAWEQEQELPGDDLEVQGLGDYSDELGPNGAALIAQQEDSTEEGLLHQEQLPQEQFLQDQFHIGQFTQEQSQQGQNHQGQLHQEAQALQQHHPIQQDPFPIGLVDATDCGADTMIFEFGPSLDGELSESDIDPDKGLCDSGLEKEPVLASMAAGPVNTSIGMSMSTSASSTGSGSIGSISSSGSTSSLDGESTSSVGGSRAGFEDFDSRVGLDGFDSRVGLDGFDSRVGLDDFESLRGESSSNSPSTGTEEGLTHAGAEIEPNFVIVNGALGEEGEPQGQQEQAEEDFWDAEETSVVEYLTEEEEESGLSAVEQQEEEEEEVRLEHQQRQLRLVTGMASMPHPLKASRGGEDASLSEGNWIGVADGVSLWAEQGVNSGLYSRELLWNCVDVIRSSWELLGVCPHPTAVIEEAHSRTDLRGSCTICLAVLEGQTLKVANIGDTGFVLMRFGDAVVRSEKMAHALNDPFQIGCSFGDDPSCAMVYEELVQPGDVILLATDGLFDNLFLADIVTELRTGASEGKDPELVAKRLATLAQKAGEAETGTTPYANLARAAGQEHEGGRREDVTIVVAYVEDPDQD